MRGRILVILILVVAGYSAAKLGAMYRAKSDLSQRVQHQLDFVDEAAIPSVKQDLVREAGRFGIELVPESIHIVYEDTEQRSVPQKLLEGRVASFVNKHVAISVRYEVRILGFPIDQEITQSKIKQVQVHSVHQQPALKRYLDDGD